MGVGKKALKALLAGMGTFGEEFGRYKGRELESKRDLMNELAQLSVAEMIKQQSPGYAQDIAYKQAMIDLMRSKMGASTEPSKEERLADLYTKHAGKIKMFQEGGLFPPGGVGPRSPELEEEAMKSQFILDMLTKKPEKEKKKAGLSPSQKAGVLRFLYSNVHEEEEAEEYLTQLRGMLTEEEDLDIDTYTPEQQQVILMYKSLNPTASVEDIIEASKAEGSWPE